MSEATTPCGMTVGGVPVGHPPHNYLRTGMWLQCNGYPSTGWQTLELESTYPAGSIGAMFPRVAELMEQLLTERNALEARIAALREAISGVSLYGSFSGQEWLRSFDARSVSGRATP